MSVGESRRRGFTINGMIQLTKPVHREDIELVGISTKPALMAEMEAQRNGAGPPNSDILTSLAAKDAHLSGTR
ncbi:hypothetical protein NECAME_00098 [Necator americanus]|uniref:Uncharacterized protein n=1 Tax=Necator americanus TaxID=51031 RepID=W2TZX9_NECAM|nr:hypothetical protein NECAME_00098 [Necator americanus]ETN87239.1 hypothetical protein NECAME_00098 [Necator americanus]